MAITEQQQGDITTESRRLAYFESQISQLQELLSVRDLAVSRAEQCEFDRIDKIFIPVLDEILRKMDEDIEQHGPFTARALQRHTDPEDKTAA